MKIFKQIMFWFLSLTWGIVMTLIGFVIMFILLLGNYEIKIFYHYLRMEVGRNWGGFEMGPIFFTDESPLLYTKQHEAGHGIQNIMFGPLMPFIVSIPSAIRYWFREQRTQKGKYIFCSILLSIFLIIGLAFLIPGAITVTIWSIVIGSIIVAYTICLACWLFIKELPQYANNANVGYYDIWFERQANQLGQKYFPEDNDEA